MAKMTSAEAAKLLKKLNEELRVVEQRESQSKDFLAALGEDPETVRPKYDYEKTCEKIDGLERKIRLLKHAINVFNTTTVVPEINMTIDQALVYIPQLTRKCDKLWGMMSLLPKSRMPANRFSSVIDYKYTNYNTEDVERDYYKYKQALDTAQLQLDQVNSTCCLTVDDEVIG